MRTTNRILAAVLGLLLLVGGLLTAVEIALAYAGRGPWVVPYEHWYRTARSHDWQSGSARGIFVVIGMAGLVLIALQLMRRQPPTLPLQHDSDATYAVRRRSLERSLRRSTEHVDGVQSARVKIARRAIRITAHSHRRLPGDVKPAIHAAIDARLHELELENPPPVRISVRLREGTA